MPRAPTLRPLVHTAALAVAALLAACGGGGGGGESSIADFSADRSSYHVGEQATLSARYQGDSAQVDNGVGAVASGDRVQTRPLDISSTFTLTVQRAGAAPQSRSLTLTVDYRNRYQTLAAGLPLSGHAAVALADGSVLLIGGSRAQKALSERVDRVDPVTRQLQPLAALNEGRWQPQAVLLADGQVLVGAGTTNGLDARLLELVDPVRGTVTPVGRLSVPRPDAAAVRLADGRVLFCGGVTTGEGAELGISASCDLWDPATRNPRRLATRMQMPRANHTMTRLRDGRVLVAGGYSTATPYRYAEVFDPASESFTAINAPVKQPLAQQVALLHTDGSVLLMGGETPHVDHTQPRAEVWRFDPVMQTFSARPPLAQPRTLAAGVGLRDGRVLLFGGDTAAATRSGGGELYDMFRGGQPLADSGRARAYLSASRLPDGRVLVAGGEDMAGGFAGDLLVYE